MKASWIKLLQKPDDFPMRVRKERGKLARLNLSE